MASATGRIPKIRLFSIVLRFCRFCGRGGGRCPDRASGSGVFGDLQFVGGLLPLVHLVVVTGLQVVVVPVVGLVVFGRRGELRIVDRDLLLDFGQPGLDRLDVPAQLAQQLLLLLALLVGGLARGYRLRVLIRGGSLRRALRCGGLRRRVTPLDLLQRLQLALLKEIVDAAEVLLPRRRETRRPCPPCRRGTHGRAKRQPPCRRTSGWHS